MRKKRYLIGILTVALTVGCLLNLSGCSRKEIAFTTGLAKDEVFKIDGEECTIGQAQVVLLDLQREYEALFGMESWDQPFGVSTLESYVKEQALEQLSQIYSMALLAKSKEVELKEKELKELKAAAKEYMDSIRALRDEVEIQQEDVEAVYINYALANKYYTSLIETVDSEISDDEARIITVQHILLKTPAVTAEGVEVSEAEMTALYEKANEIRQMALNGENFQTLATRYSEDELIQYTFGRGERPDAFETAAFDLANDGISEVIETEEGLHIIKCISNYDEAATNANKEKIYEQRCTNLLNKTYDAFILDVLTEFNQEAWETVKVKRKISVIEVSSLFELYRAHFPKEEAFPL